MIRLLNLVLIAIVFCFLFVCKSFAVDESLTITTYYPSPYGSYNILSVANSLQLRNGSGTAYTTDGPQIEWRTGTTGGTHTHWNIDQMDVTGLNPRLRLFTERDDDSNGSEKVTILANGTVGIGTVIPSTTALLHIVGVDNNVGVSPNFYPQQVWISSSDQQNGRLELGYRYDALAASYGRLQAYETWTGGGGPMPLILNDAGGVVGIGTSWPTTTYALYVNGSAYATGAWSSSDLRWKKNITTLDNPLEKLLRLRGVKFDWKRKEFKDRNFPEGKQIGIIAQELEKEFPELVMTDSEGYKSIAYDKLTAVLLEAVKAQQKEIEGLKKELASIKIKINK